MDNCLLLCVTLSIFLGKTNNQEHLSILRDQTFTDVNPRAFDNYEASHHLSTDDKRRIYTFLKSFTRSERPSPKPMKLLSDPASYCRSFRICSECLKSIWYPCGWCHNYGCTDKTDKLCAYAMTKQDFVNTNATDESQKLCAHIENDGPVLVPAGVRHNVHVKIHVTDPVLYEKDIICQLQFKDRVTHLKALILDDVVYCYPVALKAAHHGETNMGVMRLIWGGVQPFSNKVPIAVYKCEYLATDCESCRLIPAEYGCGWCIEENTCVIADKCSNILMWNINRLTCKSVGKKMYYV